MNTRCREWIYVPDGQTLRQFLDQNQITARNIRIHGGFPDRYFGRRRYKKLHANLGYKNGVLIRKSKAMRDEIYDGVVVKAYRCPTGQHYDYDVILFIPYGHRHDRIAAGHDREDDNQAVNIRVWTATYPPKRPRRISDDELPF